MKVLYFDCFSGLSGDMTLAALVDAGADPAHIEQELNKLSLGNVKLSFDSVIKKGVSAKKLHITVAGEKLKEGDSCLDHDHNGHMHSHGHHHDHTHDHHRHGHHQNHAHEHHGQGHTHHHSPHHHHRRYQDIVHMIQESDLTESVKERSSHIFKMIGISEAKIHNIPLETVHFHEVGALDSIIDIVGTAIALEILGIEKIYSSPVAVGSGYIKCDHGLYPVPAPATLEMLKGIPIRESKEEGELTTPTGAGIISALASGFGPLPAMTIHHIGYGAGTRELMHQPNVLRVVIGEQ